MLVLIAASFYLYGRLTESLVYQQNPTRGRLLVDTALIQEHWENWNPSTTDAAPAGGGNFGAAGGKDEFQELIQELSKTWQMNKFDKSFIRPDKVEKGEQQIDEFEREFLALASQGRRSMHRARVRATSTKRRRSSLRSGSSKETNSTNTIRPCTRRRVASAAIACATFRATCSTAI